MKTALRNTVLLLLVVGQRVQAGQVPGSAAAADTPISHHDRVYAAEQFSNTVSVIDPVDNLLLGVIRLGEPQPANFSPLYRGQVLVHGLGFSPDSHTLAVVSIGSNSVTFIDTQSGRVKHTTYLGRSPHEAFFTPDGHEVWVSVRGENYISVLDGDSYEERNRIQAPNGPGMTIFSPDGRLAYVCSSFVPELDIFDVQKQSLVGKVVQPSPFCPNIAAAPDGTQVWFTLKDVGQTVALSAKPPFSILKIIDTGPITNHVNFVRNRNGQFAYVTVGALNEVQVYKTSDFSLLTRIPVGELPHGLWPSGDGSRVYVGLENADAMAVIDTLTNHVIAQVPIGQAPQAVVYVSGAVPDTTQVSALQPLDIAGSAAHLSLKCVDGNNPARTSVSLFDQGLVEVLQAAVAGLDAKQSYVLALASSADGSGPLQPLQAFTTNPTGAAIVNSAGPIRRLVQPGNSAPRRYLVIARGTTGRLGPVVQVQAQ
jgi:YVTN family beta-propeller protein